MQFHIVLESSGFLESLHPTPILSPIAQGQQLGVESQAKAQVPIDMNHPGSQAAVHTGVVQKTRTIPGENVGTGVFDDHTRPTNQYSTGQYQHALELYQRRLSRTQHGNYANVNCSASHSEIRDPDYRDASGRAPDDTTSFTPADSAPDVPDEEFYWYNSMTEMQRQKRDPEFPRRFFRTSPHVICRLRIRPVETRCTKRMFTWRSVAWANDIASRNVQRGS
jgi:hypothetical protein